MNNSCVSYYKNINLKDTTPTSLIISHPDGRSWKLDGNVVKLNTGDQISIQKYSANDVYNNNGGRVGLFIDGNKVKALRHNNYYLTPEYFKNADYFSWLLIPSDDGYKIYNDWNGGWYLGYNAERDLVMILSPGDPGIVVWNIADFGGIDNKNQLKALSYMVKGKALYPDIKEFQDVNLCVLPDEVKNDINLNNCLLKNTKGTILNSDLISTKGGTLTERDKGDGIYPSEGCGIISNNSESFTKTVENIADIIKIKTKEVLKTYKKQMAELDSEIYNLKYKEIPAKTTELNDLITKYNKQKDICDGYPSKIVTKTALLKNTQTSIDSRTKVSDILDLEDKRNIDISSLDASGEEKDFIRRNLGTVNTLTQRRDTLKKIIKCNEPYKSWIFSPNWKPWRYDGGLVRLNSGAPLPVTLATGYTETYAHGLGYGLMFMIDRPGGNWTYILRHSGWWIRAQTDWGTSWHNNYDFAWKFERVIRKPYTNEMVNTQFRDYLIQDSEGNIYNNYVIKNIFNGGTVMGYDPTNDVVTIVNQNDSRRMEWIIMTAWGW